MRERENETVIERYGKRYDYMDRKSEVPSSRR